MHKETIKIKFNTVFSIAHLIGNFKVLLLTCCKILINLKKDFKKGSSKQLKHCEQ